MPAPLPENEAERLAALHEHHILDTAPQEEFEDLVRLAAHICGVPIAAVSLIDEHRQWFKAIRGLDVRETTREAAFCAHTILQPDMFIVPDAHADARFADNPLVTGDPRIRFYAGAPLLSEDGYALGSLCVIDRTPRTLTPEQTATLQLLARQVSSQLRAARRVAAQERLITEREQMVQEQERLTGERARIEAERMRLAAIVESSEEAVLGATLDGTLVSWNRAAEKLYGYSAAEIIGRHISFLCPAGERSPVPATVACLRRGETAETLEVVHQRGDGTEFHAALTFSPIRDAAGDMVGVSCTTRDITLRKRAEEALQRSHAALQKSQARLAEAQRVGKIGSWEYDLGTGKITWSDELFRLFEMDPAEGEPSVEALMARYHADDVAMHAAVSTQAMQDGLPYEFDIRVLKQDGSVRWAHAVGRGEHDTAGQVVRLFGTLMDVHERKMAEADLRARAEQLHRSEAALRTVLEAAPLILYAADADGTVTLSEGTGLTALGLKPGEAVGRSVFEFSGGDAMNESSTRRALRGEAVSYDAHVYNLCLHTELRPVRDAAGAVTGLIGVCMDVTERMKAEERVKDHAVVLEFQKTALETANAKLEALATTDGMTGLKNHRAFQEQLVEEVSRAARYHTPLSLALLDVDHFKGFNDAFGHPAGDAVLTAVASILQESARETDVVARYGGEEFVLILPQTDAAGAALFAERLRAAIESAPWPLRAITASFGLATLRWGIEEGGSLVTRADKALYRSKTGGRNRVTASSQHAPATAHAAKS